MVTHNPPKESIPVHRRNRNRISSTCIRAQQPLESSRRPHSIIRNHCGNSHSTHRSRNAIITRNITTQPHTLPMIRTDADKLSLIDGLLSAVI